ncbi:MAG: mechanosensitive ion channel family protein [Bacteroidia bacterium]|nr:MAG: mechanosensitive ion channel family protein [Bacteroidia bacterium]
MKLLQIDLRWFGDLIQTHGWRFIGAVVLLIVGLWLAGKLSRIFYNVLEKREIDPSLRSFLKSIVGVLLKVLVVFTILALVGVPMTSFIAVLGAVAFAIGLALSGTLQNFAGGVLILIIKPFKVGDFIEAQGFMGTVKDIQVFHTVLQTPDNVIITVPNGGLSTGSVTNYSVNETRRAQWVFGIAYGDNAGKAKAILKKILDDDPRVLKEPEHLIFLSELNDSSVDITVRAWAKAADFWPLNFDIHEKVYEAFEKEGINIPFPQMDVHLHQKAQAKN